MQMLANINKMMEKGWKMTNVNCSNCNGTTMAEAKERIQTLYCPKEDKSYPYDFEQISPQEQQSEDQKYYEQVTREMNEQKKQSSTTAKKIQRQQLDFEKMYLNQQQSEALKKTNDVSKKIGEKLLQGWAMLNQSCNDCYAPIMRSKKGEKVCFGCEKNLTEKKADPLPVKLPVQEIKKEPIQEKPKQLIVQKPISVQKDEALPQKIEKKEQLPPKQSISSIVDRIQQKSLLFLQDKIEKAIQADSLTQISRILELVYKIKSEFK